MTLKLTLLVDRWPLVAAALISAWWMAACAQPTVLELNPGSVLVSQEQVASYERTGREAAALRERVSSLEATIDALKKRIARIEPRVGLERAGERILQELPGGPIALKLPDAHRLDSKDGRAKRTSLERFVRGRRGVVIGFWATWCVPCTSAEELRFMRRLRGELQSHGGEFVSMPIDGLDKVAGDRRAATWLYPLFQRDSGHLEVLPRSFVTSVGVNLPLFVVIDRRGRATHYHNAPLNPQVIREMITHAAFRG